MFMANVCWYWLTMGDLAVTRLTIFGGQLFMLKCAMVDSLVSPIVPNIDGYDQGNDSWAWWLWSILRLYSGWHRQTDYTCLSMLTRVIGGISGTRRRPWWPSCVCWPWCSWWLLRVSALLLSRYRRNKPPQIAIWDNVWLWFTHYSWLTPMTVSIVCNHWLLFPSLNWSANFACQKLTTQVVDDFR